MTDVESSMGGTAMLEACFDRAAAHAAALALADGAGRTAASRRSVGWLRSCLRRLVT